MSYRSRSYPLAPGVVDVESARRAVAKVARERDALAQQLQRAQGSVASLQRQLQARSAENAHLAQALRSAQTQGPDAAAEGRDRLALAEQQLESMKVRLDAARRQAASGVQECDEALADRDRLRAALQAAQAQAQELRGASPGADRVQRLTADLANLRRHQAEAIERGVGDQTVHLLLEMGSVRDAVQRALDLTPGESGAWHDGLLAVLARIDQVFQREGVQLVGAPGERFDPRLHEAVGVVHDGESGYVRETVSSGLIRSEGKVLAPAKVLVGGGAR